MKDRILKDKIIAQNKSQFGRIIVVTGARQTGKTTLVKNCFPDYSYLSIEDPILRLQYKNLIAAQWNQLYPFAILDEVQKEPQLIESIKSVYDQYEKPHYILLGSSQLLLLEKVKESLAGRCIINEVYPLTIPELLTQSWDDEIKESFIQKYIKGFDIKDLLSVFVLEKEYANKMEVFKYYLKFGGYPALVKSGITDEERFSWLSNYIKTYLERDVRDLAEFRSLDSFITFQRITSILTSQLINYAYLAKEAGVSSKTAKRFLQYLEISYQVILLKPWYSNNLKRLVRTPKLHYIDPGIQRSILQKRGELTGAEFESAIVGEIFKQLKAIDFKGELYHLRTHDGKEVDLILELEEGFIPIEIKMTNNVNKFDAKHLFGLNEIFNKPVLKSFIISNDTQIKYFGENIIALPAAQFLA